MSPNVLNKSIFQNFFIVKQKPNATKIIFRVFFLLSRKSIISALAFSETD